MANRLAELHVTQAGMPSSIPCRWNSSSLSLVADGRTSTPCLSASVCISKTIVRDDAKSSNVQHSSSPQSARHCLSPRVIDTETFDNRRNRSSDAHLGERDRARKYNAKPLTNQFLSVKNVLCIEKDRSCSKLRFEKPLFETTLRFWRNQSYQGLCME